MCQLLVHCGVAPIPGACRKHTFPAHGSHHACGRHSRQGSGETAGTEGVKTSHSYQFETFSKIAAFLLFAEFPMLFQCCSHYSFLSQNKIFKQRNGLSWERRRSAAEQDNCMLSCVCTEGALSCPWMLMATTRQVAIPSISGNFASSVVSLAIPS